MLLDLKKDKKRILLALLALGILVCIYKVFFGLGNWVVYSDDCTNIKPDAVFVFGGGGPHRARYGFHLAEKYPDAVLVMSVYDSLHFTRVFSSTLENVGEYEMAEGLKNTIEEVDYVKNVMAKKYKTILLASSPYHTRRIRILARRKGIHKTNNLYIVPVPYDQSPYSQESFRHWYKNKGTREMVLTECVKILGMNVRRGGW